MSWAAVIAADFFLLSNPLVLWGFAFSLPLATALTLAGVLFNGAGRLRGSWLLLALSAYLALGWLSKIWSINPSRTLPEILKISLIAGLALVIAASTSARVVAVGVTIGATALTVGSVVVVALGLPGSKTPPRGIPPGPTQFAGIGTNVNILAYCLVAGLAMSLAFFPATRLGRVLWAGGVATTFVGLSLSASRTGWIAAGLLVIVALLLRAGWSARVSVAAVFRWVTTGAVVVLLAVTLTLPVILQRLQPDGSINFAGRLQIWEAVLQVTADRPVLGFGWGAVWPKGWESPYTGGENFIVLTEIRRLSKVTAGHGHNSAYDLLPQVGWVGVGLFCLLLLVAIVVGHAVSRTPGPRNGESRLVARVVVLGTTAVLANGLTEPMISIPLGWFSFVVTSFSAANWLRKRSESRGRRRRRRSGPLPEDGSSVGAAEASPDGSQERGETQPVAAGSAQEIDATEQPTP